MSEIAIFSKPQQPHRAAPQFQRRTSFQVKAGKIRDQGNQAPDMQWPAGLQIQSIDEACSDSASSVGNVNGGREMAACLHALQQALTGFSRGANERVMFRRARGQTWQHQGRGLCWPSRNYRSSPPRTRYPSAQPDYPCSLGGIAGAAILRSNPDTPVPRPVPVVQHSTRHMRSHRALTPGDRAGPVPVRKNKPRSRSPRDELGEQFRIESLRGHADWVGGIFDGRNANRQLLLRPPRRPAPYAPRPDRHKQPLPGVGVGCAGSSSQHCAMSLGPRTLVGVVLSP